MDPITHLRNDTLVVWNQSKSPFFGAILGQFEQFWGHLGAVFGHFAHILKHLGAILGTLGAILGLLGAILSFKAAVLKAFRAKEPGDLGEVTLQAALLDLVKLS